VAEGIRKRHSKGCSARDGGRCNCKAGYEAWVYLSREEKKVRKTFRHKPEAKAWRVDALRAASRNELRSAPHDGRTLADALADFIDGMKCGTARPKGREAYKPNTIRSYDRALRVHIASSGVGRLKAARVQRQDLQQLADELLGSGLAVGTVSNIFNPIQAFYRRAVHRASSTASRRNSGGYGGLVRGIDSSLPESCDPSAQVSSKPGEVHEVRERMDAYLAIQ
jgi:hypothetical protein